MSLDYTLLGNAIALDSLLGQLRDLIVQARTQALRVVDTIQV